MKYISMNEFLMGRAKLEDLSNELCWNANVTVTRANELLEAFGKYRKVNSGYRRPSDNVAAGGAPKSKHMSCQAVDLSDPDGKLHKFCKENPQLLETIGFWCEERQGGWQHLQIVPPKSKKRWFFHN